MARRLQELVEEQRAQLGNLRQTRIDPPEQYLLRDYNGDLVVKHHPQPPTDSASSTGSPTRAASKKAIGGINEIEWGGPEQDGDEAADPNAMQRNPEAQKRLLGMLTALEDELMEKFEYNEPLTEEEHEVFSRIVTVFARTADPIVFSQNNLLDRYHLHQITVLWRQLMAYEDDKDNPNNTISAKLVANIKKLLPETFQRVFLGVELVAHGKLLLNTISLAIREFNDPLATSEKFTRLGIVHSGRGITPDQFEAMWVAVEATLEDTRDIVWWPDNIIRALREVFMRIIGHMRAGAASDEGVAATLAYNQKRDKEIVDLLTKIAKKDKTHSRGFPEEFYLNLATSGKSVFDVEQLEPLSRFHAMRKVMDFIKLMASNYGNRTVTDTMLLELGTRHIGYNISAEQFRAAAPYFTETCRLFLDEDEWTDHNIMLVEEFYSYVSGKLIEGLSWMADSAKNKRAPTSKPFALMFTDIEGSTRLAEAMPDLMPQAVERHNQIVRRAIELYGGYEVKTIGDSFFIACQTVSQAVMIASAVQMDLLLEAPIVPGFQMFEETQASGNGWREDSLRVRVGIDWCERAEAKYDPIHKHYDYHGPDVNRCARVQSVSAGGQILLSEDAVMQLTNEPGYLTEQHEINFKTLEQYTSAHGTALLSDSITLVRSSDGVRLKGIEHPVAVYDAMPKCLSERKFDQLPSSSTASMVASPVAQGPPPALPNE